MAHENLKATVEALQSLSERVTWQPMPYVNRKGVWGMKFNFWSSGSYHFISVHNCERHFSPAGLAVYIDMIESLQEERWGFYGNRSAVLGFYATAKSSKPFDGSSDHWFMVARSNERNFLRLLRQKQRLTEEEVDLIEYFDRKIIEPRIAVRQGEQMPGALGSNSGNWDSRNSDIHL
jgi:hypothetical protein